MKKSQTSESSMASEDSAEIVVDKRMKHFLAAISHSGTRRYPAPPQGNGRAELNHEGSTGRNDRQERNSRPHSANVLGADQSVPRQRCGDAWYGHFSPATTRRWEEEGREVDRKMAALSGPHSIEVTSRHRRTMTRGQCPSQLWEPIDSKVES